MPIVCPTLRYKISSRNGLYGALVSVGLLLKGYQLAPAYRDVIDFIWYSFNKGMPTQDI